MFSYIFHGFFKNGIVHQIRKIFFKIIFLSSVFISMYACSQAFWLNLINLWTFVKSNPWSNACFKFLICMTNSVLSFKLATSFSTFSFEFCIFILSGKMINHHEISVSFEDTEHQLRENILHYFLHYSFWWNFN